MSEEKKTVVVNYLLTGQKIDVDIEGNDLVETLKSEIEKLLNIKFVDPPKLVIKRGTKRNMRIVDDMKQTISDAHIHTFDKIVISKTDVVGGQ